MSSAAGSGPRPQAVETDTLVFYGAGDDLIYAEGPVSISRRGDTQRFRIRTPAGQICMVTVQLNRRRTAWETVYRGVTCPAPHAHLVHMPVPRPLGSSAAPTTYLAVMQIQVPRGTTVEPVCGASTISP